MVAGSVSVGQTDERNVSATRSCEFECLRMETPGGVAVFVRRRGWRHTGDYVRACATRLFK